MKGNKTVDTHKRQDATSWLSATLLLILFASVLNCASDWIGCPIPILHRSERHSIKLQTGTSSRLTEPVNEFGPVEVAELIPVSDASNHPRLILPSRAIANHVSAWKFARFILSQSYAPREDDESIIWVTNKVIPTNFFLHGLKQSDILCYCKFTKCRDVFCCCVTKVLHCYFPIHPSVSFFVERNWAHVKRARFISDTYPWANRNSSLFANYSQGIRGGVCRTFAFPCFYESQASVNENQSQRDTFHPKAFIFAGIVLFVGGCLLLYKAWWNVSFNLSGDSNIALYIACLIGSGGSISAAVVLTFAGIGMLIQT